MGGSHYRVEAEEMKRTAEKKRKRRGGKRTVDMDGKRERGEGESLSRAGKRERERDDLDVLFFSEAD